MVWMLPPRFSGLASVPGPPAMVSMASAEMETPESEWPGRETICGTPSLLSTALPCSAIGARSVVARTDDAELDDWPTRQAANARNTSRKRFKVTADVARGAQHGDRVGHPRS